MATQVPIPKLGQSEETVTIVKWHKSEGDTVAKGDVLFEIETDKAVLEVESQFEGTLLKIVVPANQEVPVMSIAAVLGDPGEPLPAIQQPVPATPATAASAPPPPTAATRQQATTPATAPATTAATGAPQTPPPTPTQTAAKPPAAPTRAVSPRAKKFAAGFLIDLNQVQGTGPGGRVVERDVQAYLDQSGYFQCRITPAAENLARDLGLPLLNIKPTGVTGRITLDDVRRTDAEKPRPMSKMRQIIARRMVQSKQQIPHFYVTVGVDMTEMIAWRRQLKDAGYAIGINDLILKAVGLTLREFPKVNSHTDDGISVVWNSQINIGMAVSLEEGLVVPVLRNVDQLALDELNAAAHELADKARTGKLLPDDMRGGTFTISNMGMLNVDEFAAIINPGEGAILAVSSTKPTPVVNEQREIVVRDMMNITLSADHRIIDGALAAQFANAVKQKLEDLELWKDMVA